MKKLIFISIILFASIACATTAYLQGSFMNGMVKTCVYDCMGTQIFINVDAYKICELSIETKCGSGAY